MDFFGIGNAVKAVVRTYFQTSRGTGRTTSLIESVKDGDRIIFTNMKQAKHVEFFLKERGLAVECVVMNPKDIGAMLGTSQGKTIFDHAWVEEAYENAIEDVDKTISYLEKQMSGFGAPHYETRRKAREISRFGKLN